MEDSIFASFPILAARHASMLVLATGFLTMILIASPFLFTCNPRRGWFRSRVGFSRARGRQSVRATSESARRHQRMDALL